MPFQLRRVGGHSSRDTVASRCLRPQFESLDARRMLSVNVELLADIFEGEDSGLLAAPSWAELDGFVYFGADDGIGGVELWRTDGTEAGTTLVADINDEFPEDPFSFYDSESSFPIDLTVFNDELYFAAETATGDELWKSDGTAEGTVQVVDLNPGDADSIPFFLTVFRNELYFSASDGQRGDELWKTDGTEAGTVLVADINPGEASSFPAQLFVFNDELYFSAAAVEGDTELWKTDGTEQGTVLVRDIHEGSEVGSFPESLFEFNDELYFIAGDGITPDDLLSSHLYKSDGTAEGTVRVTEERLTVNFADTRANVIEFNDHLYFGGISVNNEWEMYRTDGSVGSSNVVANLAGVFSSRPSDMVAIGNQLYFVADDESGRQLWRTNGLLGEQNVTERLTSVENGNAGAFPTELREYNGELVFNAYDGTTFQVWRTDKGVAEPVTRFELNDNSASFNNFVEFDGRLLFRAPGEEGLELWSLQFDEVVAEVLLDGDVDGNGKVEFADFLVLSRNFAQSVDGRSEGDLDGNGKVEFADFLLLAQNFGAQVEEIFASEFAF